MGERFLVTGAAGCIGAWTLAHLIREGTPIVALDTDAAPGRARLLLSDAELRQIVFVTGDITDPALLSHVLDQYEITHVIHLAALQYPYCRDDHLAGAHANLIGTLHVFDAVLGCRDRPNLAYASSIGALNSASLYGAWKVACERMASAFWEEDHVPSIGIRPAIVYGVGRDRGITAAMTKAMLAAALGVPFHIVHGGTAPTQHAGDVADIFIRATRAAEHGSGIFNTGGQVVDMSEVVGTITRLVPSADITFDDRPFMTMPSAYTSAALEAEIGPVIWRPLDQGITQTIERFTELAKTGLVSAADLSG